VKANPETAERALVAAETAAKALWNVLDGFEARRNGWGGGVGFSVGIGKSCSRRDAREKSAESFLVRCESPDRFSRRLGGENQ